MNYRFDVILVKSFGALYAVKGRYRDDGQTITMFVGSFDDACQVAYFARKSANRY